MATTMDCASEIPSADDIRPSAGLRLGKCLALNEYLEHMPSPVMNAF